MDVIKNLVREREKLSWYSRAVIEPIVAEIAEIQSIVQEMFEAALDMQNLLFNMSILLFEVTSPLLEEYAEQLKTDDALDQSTANIAFYISYANAISNLAVDGLASLRSHKTEIPSISIDLHKHFLPMLISNFLLWTFSNMASAKTGAINRLILNAEKFDDIFTADKSPPHFDWFLWGAQEEMHDESVIENIFFEEQIRSIGMINQVENVLSGYKKFEDYSLEKNSLKSIFILEKAFDNLTGAAFQLDQQNRMIFSELQKFELKFGHTSFITGLTAAAVSSLLQKNESMFERILRLNEIDAYKEIVADFSKYMYSAVDNQLEASYAQELLHISHLDEDFTSSILKSESAVDEIDRGEYLSDKVVYSPRKIDLRTAGKLIEERDRKTLYLQSVIEVPALLPLGQKKIASENVARIQDAISNEHTITDLLGRRSIVSQRKPDEKPVNIPRVFESLTNLITSFLETNSLSENILKEAALSSEYFATWDLANHFLQQDEMASPLFQNIITRSDWKIPAEFLLGGMMPSIILADALSKETSSAIEDISLVVPASESSRGLSIDWGPRVMSSVFNNLSILKENDYVRAAGNSEVNIQNSFNIVINTDHRGDEAEIGELGRKIGRILSEEIRRYGGLR